MIEKKRLSYKLTPGRNRGLTYVNSAMLSIAIGAFMNSLFQLHTNIILIMLASCFFSGCIMLFDINKKKLSCYFTILGIIIAGIILTKIFKYDCVKTIRRVLEWCTTYDREKIHYDRFCGYATMAGILCLCCIITYICHKFKKIKFVLAVVFIVLLIIACVSKVFVPKVTVGILLIYTLVIIVELCGIKLHKNNNVVDNSTATIYLVPVCLLIAVLAVSLPSNSKPIQWKGVKNFIHMVQDKGSMLVTDLQYYFGSGSGEFGINFTSYSDDDSGELGGKVRVSNKNTLKIFTNVKSTARGYLIGSISDSYTGRKWEKSKTKQEYGSEDYYLDFFELLLCFTRANLNGVDLENIVQKRNYEITFKDIKTKTIFYPLKTYRVSFKRPTEYKETNQGALLLKKAKGNGTAYDTSYYELNLNSDVLKSLLRNPGKQETMVTEDDLSKTGVTYFYYNTLFYDLNIDGLKKDLLKRSEDIKARYTTLPDTLPDRVKELAFEITKNYDNDYDKLKAIEAYLNTMTYSLEVDNTPKGEDFVDYFLFEQQKGYCTYFASAMGVLARCVGIPTRYVEGYVVDYKDKPKMYTYNVYSKNAHSWIDAYIEGVGWIPFEPTPGFYEGRYTKWKEVVKSEQQGSNVPVTTVIPTPPVHESIELDNLENKATKKVTFPVYLLMVFAIVLCIILIIAAIIFLYFKLLEMRYKRKYINSSQRERLTMKLGETLHYISKDGYKLPLNETLYSYAKRIGNNLKFDEVTFLKVVLIYMRSRYGDKDILDSDFKIVDKYCKDLKKHMKIKLGKRKMFFDRFMFLHHNL